MHVVQLNTSDVGAGAEQVVSDLDAALAGVDVSSSMVVGRRAGGVTGATEIRYYLPLERRLSAIAENLLSLQGVLYPSTLLLQHQAPFRHCDVVHLHNAHGEYLNTSALASLSRRIPLVWTLHDQWALTGKCVYSHGCDAWQRTCGNCPILSTPPVLRRDRTALLMRYKRAVYRRADLCVVCPSRWLADMARRSHLGHFRIEHIPNGIDTALFRPRRAADVRARAGSSTRRPRAIFVSSDLHSEYKGFSDLQSALPEIGSSIHLSTIGSNRGASVFASDEDGHELGFIASREDLARELAAADFSVMPSTAENHSLSALEAMACSTPVIAYRSGGLPEQIVDGETGILVPPSDRRALVEAIRFMADNPDACATMGRAAAERVADGFTRKKMAERYRSVYEREIERRRARNRAGSGPPAVPAADQP